jgi:type IV secretory pathway VirB2 component (pilin)
VSRTEPTSPRWACDLATRASQALPSCLRGARPGIDRAGERHPLGLPSPPTAAQPTRVACGVLLALALALCIGAGSAFAQSAPAPWEGPICVVARSLSGPVARAVAVIAIVITGLMIAFGELGGVFRSLLGLVFGISFALLADQWLGLIRAGATTACFGG